MHMENLTQLCDQCDAEIKSGEKYGMLVFNLETLEPSDTEADGEVNVLASEPLEVLCMTCATEYVHSLGLEDL